MKVAVEEPGKWERVLTVEVPAEEVARDLEAVYRELADRVAFPGFRKGKAPRHLIRARYGKSIESEVLERVVPRAYHEALEENRILALSDPEFEQLNYTEDAPLTFQARVKIGPSFAPAGYKGMKLKLVVAPIEDDAVTENVDSLRERHADFVPVDRESVAGDLVVVDLVALGDTGEPLGDPVTGFPIHTGEYAAFAEFATAVVGARAGETREAAREFKPKDDPEGAIKTARYRLSVTEVREKRLPAPDDDFARRIPKKSEEDPERFESLAELTDEIRRRLGIVEEMRATERMADEAVATLLAQHNIEVPDFLADQLLEDVQVRDEDVDPVIVGDREEKTKKLRIELRPRAERRVQRSLLLTAIAREEKLGISRAEVDREISRIAAREGVSAQEVRETLEKRDAIGGLRERLLEEKVARFILEHAEVERETPSRLIKPGDP
ncbi:MAG: trigger factor [bacterium]